MKAEHGVLFPKRLPQQFQRIQAENQHRHLVAWWWIAQWQLPEGKVSRQTVLAFPASNLVVEPELFGLWGPTTRVSYRDLTGTGWAVAAHLKPAGLAALTTNPLTLRDHYQALTEPGLHASLRELMRAARPRDAVKVLGSWLQEVAGPASQEALVANRLAQLAGEDPTILTVGDLAAALNVSQRTLHRIAERYIGLTPFSLIRRRRLQEAAAEIRTSPESVLGEIAARSGFTDQSHLTREFKTVLGFTPAAYRRDATS